MRLEYEGLLVLQAPIFCLATGCVSRPRDVPQTNAISTNNHCCPTADCCIYDALPRQAHFREESHIELTT